MHAPQFPSAGSSLSRRQFVQASSGIAALGAAAMTAPAARAQDDPPSAPLVKAGDVILFQGDSITDAGRDRKDAAANSQRALGNGYAWLAAAQLQLDHAAAKLTIYNRGISGNKVYQLAERWDADCVQLKPTVVSILIGVNDIWHTINRQYDGTIEKYETDYRALLERTQQALPDARLVICEPFVLRCGAVTDKWFPEFDGYRDAARELAYETGAAFVPFHTMFEAASEIAPPERWAKDGVHPTSDGAMLMAHEWLKTLSA